MLPLVFAAEADPVSVAATPAASSALPAPTPAPDAEGPRRLRNGFVLGLTLGGGVASGAGYPNDQNDLGATDYQRSGWLPGTGTTILIMGAIADDLNFGFWYGRGTFKGGADRESQSGAGLRIEGFPLAFLCPRFGGLGIFSSFGLGTASLSTPNVPNAGGTQSIVAAGAFYEWAVGHVLGGHFGLGPGLEYDATFTEPYHQNAVVATLRGVWYGGP
jgi:hypothetical protein